ncbi:MAG: hypothetical protein RQ899_08325 [Pseudomonadales bacterium]|nr:hypothetical protein [Pseudomonadales bacterium]
MVINHQLIKRLIFYIFILNFVFLPHLHIQAQSLDAEQREGFYRFGPDGIPEAVPGNIFKSTPRRRPDKIESNQYKNNENSEWVAMHAALRRSESLDGLIPADQAILSMASSNVNTLNNRATQLLDQVCREILQGNHTGSAGAAEVGRIYELSETYEKEDIIAYYQQTLASLSTAGALALNQRKSRIRLGVSGSNMDWLEYAQTEPEKFLEEATLGCEQRGGVGGN